MSNHDPARLLAEVALLRLLGDLPPGTPPFTISARSHGFAGVIRIGPPSELPPQPGTCRELSAKHREVLEAATVEIARLGRGVLGSEIRGALMAAGTRWGVSTVNTTLADLVNLGLLINHNDKRGYFLPDPPRRQLHNRGSESI